MPLYDFRCMECGWIQEDYALMNDSDPRAECRACGGMCEKIISFQGGFKTDHPAWLNNQVRAALQGEGEKPIETRKEHDQYLKDNGIVQLG